MTLKLIGCSRVRGSEAQQVNDRMNFLERIAGLPPKRLALLAAELNTRLERLEQRSADPIAVIGIGCRFPGGANDPDSFWRLLIEGRDAIVEVPPGRWDIDALYDPDPGSTGKMNTRWGGFLDGIDQFDPEFFGISPREATGMDPQQRVLLEVAWEALENAGLCPDRLAGSQTGVFVGVCNNDYFLKQFEAGRDAIDAYVATGNAHSVASGRISYLLGLQGPSLSVDTGCSASLVAVHLACQSLRAGECRAALAGGVNVILMPDMTIVLSKARMMSPDGRCKAFDASADGFVRSEGCGVVVLKRLSDAQADADRILAVIRGTASNQDGRSNGLTAPNGPSQVAVIREALANAALEPDDVDYIEAHGTGTSLGDPIEAHALADVFGPGRSLDCPLRIGSVKTNFGHTESAAGIAGLIKAILALKHEKIPPSLHLQKLNPHIAWGDLPIAVATTPTPWTRERGQRIAGVSSFGFSGTNAHAIVSDPPTGEMLRHSNGSVPALDSVSSPELLVLSARSESALLELAGNYEQLFTDQPDLRLPDICRTASNGRSHFEHRLAVLARDLPEASEALTAFRSARTHVAIRSGRAPKTTPGVVFMFTGQGSQYPGMGRGLFDTQPVFRHELEKCAEIVNPLLGIPLLEILFADSSQATSRIDQTQYTQPALFALEYALAAMWRSWGVEPEAVLGHSVGEYVAACVAGVFGLEDGLRLIAERARLMGSLPSGGAMAAVFADEHQVSLAIQAQGSQVAIACINGPGNIVVSGQSDAVDRLLSELKNEGVGSRSLVVSHAFHSELMGPVLDPFLQVAASVRFAEPLLPIVSNVTGKVADRGLMSAPEYWRQQICNPVRFADSICALRESGHSVFLEIGPQPVLTGMARATATEADVVWVSSLNRGREDWENLLEAVSTLYTRGVTLEWSGIPRPGAGKRVSLPTYPFQRSRFWLQESGISTPCKGSEDADWFYQLEWRSQQTSVGEGSDHAISGPVHFDSELGRKPSMSGKEGTTKAPPGLWIILADDHGIAEQLEHLISDRGQECLLVSPGREYEFEPAVRARVDPLRAADFRRLFLDASVHSNGPLKGVLNLWPVNEELGPEATPVQWEAAQDRIGGGLLNVTQAFLESASLSGKARIWFATRGAQYVESKSGLSAGSCQPVQAIAWGLGRVISLEHPSRFGALIDLDRAASLQESAAAIWHEIEQGDDEDAVAYRNSERLVPRVVRAEQPPSEPLFLRRDGSYLITGGLGGLGLRVADWMAANGAGQVVLLSRRKFPDRALWPRLAPDDPARQAVDAIARAEKLGTKVTVVQADVSDENTMRAVLDRFSAEGSPLRGIVHCAVDLTGCSISDLDLSGFQQMCRAKALGAWVLNRLTLRMELDFFVLFSSIAAVWGAANLGHYAAANQVLDALAHWRRTRGLTALSVNWGTWQEMRLATETDKQEFERAGMYPMPNDRALEVLGRLISNDRTSAVVASVDWDTLRGVYQVRRARPLFSDILPRSGERRALAEKKPVTRESDFTLKLQSASPARRRDLLIAHLRSLVANVLGFAPSREIDLDQGLFDLGMDSITSIEFKERLERTLGLQLPSTLAFNHPNIKALTDYILCDALKFASESKAEMSEPRVDPAKNPSSSQLVDDLSEDEIAHLLQKKLEEIK
jgi:acyl transferase domain-containing protein/acyl carrier protein